MTICLRPGSQPLGGNGRPEGRAAQRKKARQEAVADAEEEDRERPSKRKSGGVAASTATGGKAHDSPAPTEDDEMVKTPNDISNTLLGVKGDGDATANSSASSEDVTKRDDTTQTLDETLLNGPAGFLFRLVMAWNPPKWILRTMAAFVLAGQVMLRIAQGKIHMRNTIAQLKLVGPSSLGVCLLTASFVGMVFTIQFVREFTKLGLTRSIGELGTMQVSEQTATLRVLRTDPVDYLVTPRVLACVIAVPVLTALCFTVGMAASVLLAEGVYEVGANIMLDSAQRTLTSWDIISSELKSVVFGFIISVVSCSWGYTTTGGAKGVGESTTSAVVISLVGIFVADFILSYLFFQGQGDALTQLV
eukprot:jgi/Tetstr1/454461/TSEL_041361.t1